MPTVGFHSVPVPGSFALVEDHPGPLRSDCPDCRRLAARAAAPPVEPEPYQLPPHDGDDPAENFRVASPEPTPGLRERIEAFRKVTPRPTQFTRGWNAALDEAAALAASPAPEPTGLDAAWAEAEAALPEGWRLSNIIWPTPDDDEYAAVAVGHGRAEQAEGPTPEAALRALAARLGEKP